MKMRTTVLAVVMAITPQTRAMIHRALRPDKFDVVWAADAAEAVEESARHRPDLVLLELTRQLHSSRDVFENLRAAHPSAPMVVLAERGATQNTNLVDSKVALVEKPVDAAALTYAVNALLSSLVGESGAAGDGRRELAKARERLPARHDTPFAWAPSYRHWGINE